jgi:hypothetical protein
MNNGHEIQPLDTTLGYNLWIQRANSLNIMDGERRREHDGTRWNRMRKGFIHGELSIYFAKVFI